MDHPRLLNFLKVLLLFAFVSSVVHFVDRVVVFEILFDNTPVRRVLAPSDTCKGIRRRYFSGQHAMLSVLRNAPSGPVGLVTRCSATATLHKITHHFIIKLFLLQNFIWVVILSFGQSPAKELHFLGKTDSFDQIH